MARWRVMSGAVRIVDAYWDRFLAVEPLFATAVGDARFDDVLPDPSEEGRAERHRVHTGLLEAAAGVDASGLDPEERRTLLLAVALARRELGCLTHNMDRLWAVGHMPIGHRYGPGLLLGVVAFQQPAETTSQRAAYLRRLAAFPAYIEAVAANAAEGLDSGVVASRAVLTRTIGQVERLLATPVADSPALAPLVVGTDEERSRRVGHADPAEAVAALEGRPGGRLDSREAILALARDQVARSWEALSDWFGRLPGRNCEVAPVDLAHEDDLGDYYLAGTAKRAGTYFVNTRAPRPAYDLAATSFHEANPGHHLQSALELEAPGRHALRRNAAELQGAAYVEGWGLYSERLGMLDLQALRAARLVVDTGIHAFGWTREQSIATLRASGCDVWLAASETDRYSAIPGQALTYKLGQLEIEDLRKRWVAGGSEVRGFHDTLLGLGLLPLASLRPELETARKGPR